MRQGKVYTIIGKSGAKGRRFKDDLLFVPHGHWVAVVEVRNLGGTDPVYVAGLPDVEMRFRERAVIVSLAMKVTSHPARLRVDSLSNILPEETGRLIAEESVFVSAHPFAVLVEREFRQSGNVAEMMAHMKKPRFSRRLVTAKKVKRMDLWDEVPYAKFETVAEDKSDDDAKSVRWVNLAALAAVAGMTSSELVSNFLAPPLFSLPEGHTPFVVGESGADLARGKYRRLDEPANTQFPRPPREAQEKLIWIAEPMARGIMQLIGVGLRGGNRVLRHYEFNV